MKVKYESPSNTGCTRSLAFMSEAGLMPDRVQITKNAVDSWSMSFFWEVPLQEDALKEIDYHCSSYGAHLVP
jgi:hypothetical protein